MASVLSSACSSGCSSPQYEQRGVVVSDAQARHRITTPLLPCGEGWVLAQSRCFLRREQPSGAANAGRIAVLVFYDFGADHIGEDVGDEFAANARVQGIDVRKPAAEHDDVGIEDIDN